MSNVSSGVQQAFRPMSAAKIRLIVLCISYTQLSWIYILPTLVSYLKKLKHPRSISNHSARSYLRPAYSVHRKTIIWFFNSPLQGLSKNHSISMVVSIRPSRTWWLVVRNADFQVEWLSLRNFGTRILWSRWSYNVIRISANDQLWE